MAGLLGALAEAAASAAAARAFDIAFRPALFAQIFAAVRAFRADEAAGLGAAAILAHFLQAFRVLVVPVSVSPSSADSPVAAWPPVSLPVGDVDSRLG